MQILYGVIVLFSFTVGIAHAGFDFGPVGNGLFWVGLCFWSAGVAWVLYLRRNMLGKRLFSLLRTVFAPHKKAQIVLSAPKYRPYVETTHVVDSLERAAESFLSATKTGVHAAQHVTREALSVLEHDTDTALKAVRAQRARVQSNTTSLTDRVRNIKNMIAGRQKSVSKTISKHAVVHEIAETKKEAIQSGQSIGQNEVLHNLLHDDASHTRQKVRVLSDAHRALIRARNAQHDLPVGGEHREAAPAPVLGTQQHSVAQVREHHRDDMKDDKQSQPITPPSSKEVLSAPTPDMHREKVVHEVQKLAHVQQATQNTKREQPKKSETPAQTATQDELVLDTSGPVPKLVLTRKTH